MPPPQFPFVVTLPDVQQFFIVAFSIIPATAPTSDLPLIVQFFTAKFSTVPFVT